MDRRSWLQLIAILAAAREAHPQQRGGASTPPPPAAEGAGRGGRGQGGLQNLPMRVTKEQVIGALKLMGLEFQDAELDMMLRGVNRALSDYEALRKADVPIDTEPGLTLQVPLEKFGNRETGTIFIDGVPYHVERMSKKLLCKEYKIDADTDYV